VIGIQKEVYVSIIMKLKVIVLVNRFLAKSLYFYMFMILFFIVLD